MVDDMKKNKNIENPVIRQDKFKKLEERFSNLEHNIQLEFQNIRDSLNEFALKIDGLHTINIKNGNGRIINMARNDFFQMIYDKTQAKYLLTNTFKGFQYILTLLLLLNLVKELFG